MSLTYEQMSQEQREKALRWLGYEPGGQVGQITVNGEPVSEAIKTACGPALINAENNERITAIKQEAGKRITDRYPVWKQNNLTAQAVEAILNALLSLPDTVFSQAQKQTLVESILGLGAWEWVKQVRAESDRLESILGATKDDGNWPA